MWVRRRVRIRLPAQPNAPLRYWWEIGDYPLRRHTVSEPDGTTMMMLAGAGVSRAPTAEEMRSKFTASAASTTTSDRTSQGLMRVDGAEAAMIGGFYPARARKATLVLCLAIAVIPRPREGRRLQRF